MSPTTSSLHTTPICPYCQSSFHTTEQIVKCSRCNTKHHADCWAANGGCAIHGCGSRTSTPVTMSASISTAGGPRKQRSSGTITIDIPTTTSQPSVGPPISISKFDVVYRQKIQSITLSAKKFWIPVVKLAFHVGVVVLLFRLSLVPWNLGEWIESWKAIPTWFSMKGGWFSYPFWFQLVLSMEFIVVTVYFISYYTGDYGDFWDFEIPGMAEKLLPLRILGSLGIGIGYSLYLAVLGHVIIFIGWGITAGVISLTPFILLGLEYFVRLTFHLPLTSSPLLGWGLLGCVIGTIIGAYQVLGNLNRTTLWQGLWTGLWIAGILISFITGIL